MRRLMPNRHAVRTTKKTRSRGQGLVEFALVLPILLVIFAAAADFGRAFYAYVAIENAVKEGALYGARNPLCATASTTCIDPNNVRWRVQNETQIINQDGTVLNPTIECQDGTTGVAHADLRDCVEGDRYVVRLSYQFNMLTPIIGAIMGNQITLGAQSTAAVLNRAFDPTPGAAPTKLVSTNNAANASDITSNCTQPDPVGSPGFYRQPCKDSSNLNHELRFKAGVAITYKLIGTNNGGSTISGVTMDDSDGWPGTCPAVPGSMTVSQTWECTYTLTAPNPASGTESEHTNTYTIDSAQTVAISDTAKVITYLDPPDLRVLVYLSPYQEGADGDGSILGVATFGTTQSLTAYQNARVTPSAWFKVIVTNNGGQTATGVAITDTGLTLPYGQNTATAICDSAPSSLAANAKFECRYRVPYTSAGTTRTDTVTATATNVTPDANDNNFAAVTWQTCSGGSNAVVPNMIGQSSAGATTLWGTGAGGAGFTGALTTWSGGGTALAQTPTAFTCIAKNSTGTVYKVVTP
jgi:Flp pilus assembly protein TadG